jgi:hypothetical protein
MGKGQYHLSSEKHVMMIINYTEKSGILPMSVIIFFSASKTIFFCRNDVQVIDFLRKGSYAPVCSLTVHPEIAFTMTGFCSGIYNFPKLSMVNIQSLT